MLALLVPRPRPAKIAAKARIVIGLVSVRKNVEPNAPTSVLASGSSPSLGAMARKVLSPTRHSTTPPMMRIMVFWPIRKSETAVMPKAAIQP